MTEYLNKIVGVFFGGQSPEHDISIITALLILDGMKKLGIESIPVYITTDGSWCVGQVFRNREFFKDIHAKDLYNYQRWSIDTRHRGSQLILTRRPHFFAKRERIIFDIVFPAFHGVHGEDGNFQGLCEILGVPYVGCGVESEAIAMHKGLTKNFFESAGVATTRFISFSANDWKRRSGAILRQVGKELKFPLFVKPSHAGSSIGITRICDDSQLRGAIDLAFSFDTDCIIEDGVEEVLDLTCCVRELPDGGLQASEVQESSFEGSDFFSYEEKYLKGGAQIGSSTRQIVIPARIPPTVTETIQEYSKRIFHRLGLSGIGRVDFLYNADKNQLYANEINPMPGTLYHHLWKASHVETSTLLLDLLRVAERRYKDNLVKNRYFSSSILSSVSGKKITE